MKINKSKGNKELKTQIEKITELHNRIKENKFRMSPIINLRYAKSYFDDWLELSDLTKEHLKSNASQSLQPYLSDIFHTINHYIFIGQISSKLLYNVSQTNFNSSVLNEAQEIKITEVVEQLEFVLINIHLLIDVGFLNSFRILKEGKVLQYVYNPETDEYELVPNKTTENKVSF